MDITMVGGIIARTLRHGIMPQMITEENEVARMRELASRYRMVANARPFASRIHLALSLGARIFDLDVMTLRGHMRRYADERQQLMAFTYVIAEPNYKAIGRAFDRKHATVMHAVRKYEDAIKELVG